MFNWRISKEKSEANKELEKSISNKIDSIFKSPLKRFSTYFNMLNMQEKLIIILLIFSILIILTYKQWKQIAI